MKKLHISPAFEPQKMRPADRNALADRLYTVHSRIFSGVDKTQFVKYVIHPATRTTKIYCLQNAEGNDVGYLTFQWFGRSQRGLKCNIFRTEVGILPEYRGHNTCMRVLAREITLAYLRSGLQRAYFLSTPIHPNPYCVLCNHGLQVYPHPQRPTPDRVHRLMDELAAALGIQGKAHTSRYGKWVGWKVKQTAAQREKVAGRTDMASRFYLAHNPDYHQGNGLMTLVPIHPGQGVRLLGKLLLRSLRKAWARRAVLASRPVVTSA